MAKTIKFHLTIEHLWGLIALMGIFIFVNTHPIRPYDFWWHITIGREILMTGKIPAVDIYSFTEAGQPYPSYKMFWLMETLLYIIYKTGGPALVIFIQSLLISSAYGIIFYLCKQITKSWRIAAFGVLFAAALGLNDWNVRPQEITFLLASLYLLAIYEYKQKRGWSWLLTFPLAMVVWVNSHGTFFIGLVLIAIWWGQELWEIIWQRITHAQIVNNKSLLAPSVAFVVTALACLINPNGVGILNYLKTLISNSAIQNLVIEWAAPTLNTLMGALFYGGLMISVIILALSPKRPNFFQIVTFILFGLLAIKTSRGIVWFGLVMAPIAAEHLSFITNELENPRRKPTAPAGSRIINIGFVVLIMGMGVLSLPWFKSIIPLPTAKAGLISAETPGKATQALLEMTPPAHLFNSMSFGSYLIWAAYPQYQVFVDSRIELFPDKIWHEYFDISNAQADWETLLRNYGVNTLMLSPTEQPALVNAVKQSDNWVMLYQDQTALIFERK